jgi:hypothetical protein
MPGEVVVTHALPRLLATKPPVTVECGKCDRQVAGKSLGVVSSAVHSTWRCRCRTWLRASCAASVVVEMMMPAEPQDPPLGRRGPGNCVACVLAA